MVTACDKKNPNAIYSINNYDSIADVYEGVGIDLSVEEFFNKIESKQSFSLFFYTNGCYYCNNVKEILKVYNRDNHKVFYQLEYKQEEYSKLISKLPNVFTQEIYTPRLLFFNNGELSYEVNSNKLGTKKGLLPILKSMFLDSNVSIAFSKAGLLKYAEDNSSYLAYVYDSKDKLSNDLYSQELLPKANESNKKTLIIDKNNIKSECFNYFCNYFDFSNDNSSYVFEYQNGDKIKTINYALDDGQSAKEYIVNYFQKS